MKTLIYVPVIHNSADLGSLADNVTKRGLVHLGEEVWKEYRKTVDDFWNVISCYFDSIDVSGVKIYQDGMVAEGEVGEKIVEEVSKAGSKNYELISRLLKRGAFLVKTEDFKLVKEEYDRLLDIIQSKSIAHKLIALIKYKLVKNRLLNRRDKFIAGSIAETLGQDETGILFIGAYHNIMKRLPKDIAVVQLKEIAKIRKYQKTIQSGAKIKTHQLEQLTQYMVSRPKKNLQLN